MVCNARMQRTCLNPRFSLRVQMFLSFGITAVLAISAFVIIGLYTTIGSGQSVRTEASDVLEDLIRYSLGRSAQYVAEVVEKKFDHIGGTFRGDGSYLCFFCARLIYNDIGYRLANCVFLYYCRRRKYHGGSRARSIYGVYRPGRMENR